MPKEAETETGLREARLRKLSFRAWRRGFKEADIILGNFADDMLPGMTDEELDIFEVLLEVPDQDLYGWIIERDPTPPAHQSIIMNKLNDYYKIAYTKI
ncbi:MAG: succinate dehydrogenase assembly factor 2 [Asticcacaulis sp.]|uniref:FAD assembly factor SdhE n=1 Tax=Asticcacaulis sp. TaxID=1872648 RepID=UPI0039E49926